ncbi:MAG: serine hydrolase [Candidatus Marinimicrobia bacterium]|nr:serine hydrolase [Candidatus Neomarinimicrobiota bacterium]
MYHRYINSLTFLVLAFILLAVSCSTKSFDSHQSNYPLAEDQGLNGKALEWLVEEIDVGRYGSVRSLVVMRNSEIVLEEYFEGYSRDTLQSIYSVTKSVISTLIGIAIDQGYDIQLDAPMLNYFTEYPDIQNMDAWKESITIRHLLSMSAGFDWNELDVPYADSTNIFNAWDLAEDEIQFVLDRPVVAQPGAEMSYNSGLSQLLSIILTKETGQSASEFAAENLFNHLGITEWSWSALNDSVSNGGWGLKLRPVDMVKFGRLFLQQGYWDEAQVVPEEWVAVSTDSLGIMSIWTNYGYQWWRYSSEMVEAGLLDSTGIYFASGYGGKIVWVIPYYNMVIVLIAANSDDYAKGEAMFWDYLLRIIES